MCLFHLVYGVSNYSCCFLYGIDLTMINLQMYGSNNAKMHIEVLGGIYDTIFGITRYVTAERCVI